MKNIISKDELIKKLEFIKKSMGNIEFNNKISFINLEAFYSYLRTYFNLDIKKAMEEIEPFIPLILSHKLFNLLIFSLNYELNPKKIKVFKKYFYDEARISFLNLVKVCSNKKEWERIIFVCEDLLNSYNN